MPKKQAWEVGDLFEIPLRDGSRVLGQVVGREADALNSAAVALFDLRLAAGSPPPDPAQARTATVFSALFVTRDLLDHGTWKVMGRTAPRLAGASRPQEHLRAKGWVGAKIIGSGTVREFAEAFYGLSPWDDFHDPHYLDRLLVDPSVKPHARLVYSRTEP